jgi:hypothetical protein
MSKMVSRSDSWNVHLLALYAVTGEFFGRGFFFPTFTAGTPDLERFSQTFPCHCSCIAPIAHSSPSLPLPTDI